MAFVQLPTKTAASAVISPPVTVAIEDSSGDVVTSDSSYVTVAIGPGSTGSGALGGTLIVAAVNGIATFNDLTISLPGTYTLQVSDNGELPSESFTSPSFPITAATGTPAKLAVVQQPTSAPAGITIVPSVTVAVEDSSGNVVTTDTSSMTVFIGPDSTGPGTLSGTLIVAAINGIATFSNLSISKAGSYSLWVIDGDLLPAVSSLFNIWNDVPPNVFGPIPAPGGWATDGLTPIELQVVDAASGVNLSTVVITATRDGGTTETIFDGSKVTPAAPSSYSASLATLYFGFYNATAYGNTVFQGSTYIFGTGEDYTVVFEPDADAPYDFEETVTINANATDWAGNAMISSSAPPLPSIYNFGVVTRPFGVDVQVDGGANGNNYPATATSTDANGNSIVWVVWERPDPTTQEGTIWLAERKDDATNFDTEIQVTTLAANGNCHRPSIAITAAGTIYVAYEVLAGKTNGITPASVVCVVSATTAAPTTWTPLGAVGPVVGGYFTLQTSPAVTFVNSTNTLYVAGVGQDPSSGVEEIGVSTATLSSATSLPTWTVTQVTSSAINQINPAIAQDANGVVYVVWMYDEESVGTVSVPATDIYGADSSTAFATLHQVTNTGNAGFPAIATEASGNALHFAWAANGGASNATIQYADTTAAGGWPATPFTAGTNVLDGTTGISYADYPKVAVFGSGATAHVFVVWQDERQSSAAGATDIMFAEKINSDAAFGTNSYLDLTTEVPAPNGATVPALGVTEDGEPYAAWTEQPLPPAVTNGHIDFSQAMYSRFVGPQPSPFAFTPEGGTWSFTDPNNPHIAEVDISVPVGALSTYLTLYATELRNPAQSVSGSLANPVVFADGSGVYVTITGAVDELLSDWVTVTITLPEGVSLPDSSLVTVYRLVPPTPSSLTTWTSTRDWTQDGIRNVTVVSNPPPGAVQVTFQTLYLSSFAVGLNYNEIYGAFKPPPGGCGMSPSGEPDIFVLLLPLVALGFWGAGRLIRGKRSAKA